jgi:hypothetical protein
MNVNILKNIVMKLHVTFETTARFTFTADRPPYLITKHWHIDLCVGKQHLTEIVLVMSI